MSAKYLLRRKAEACPIHKAVMGEASKQLEEMGAFSKESVIETLRFQAIEDAIRWDYIRDFLEEVEGCELVPVVSLFFKGEHTKQRKAAPIDLKPEKYLASGHGKKTAGYASVKMDAHAKLVLTRISQRKSVANGVGKAFEGYLSAVREKASTTLALSLQQTPALTNQVQE